MKITLLTANGQRHRFLAKSLCDAGHKVQVLAEPKYSSGHKKENAWKKLHFDLINEAISTAFGKIPNLPSFPDNLERGCFKGGQCIDTLKQFSPDVLISYGCGIIGEEIIHEYGDRLYGSHQGLPQYYRGAGSNLFAVVEGNAGYNGVSFHRIDSGIDTGMVLHQITRVPEPTDTYYSYSAKLVFDTVEGYVKLAGKGFDFSGENLTKLGKLYQRNDFGESTLHSFWRIILSKPFKNIYDESIEKNGLPELIGRI